MDKLISVITPCYNASKYIGRFLGSLLRQSYTKLELIIVNDGSTDDTEAIISKYKGLLKSRGIKLKYILQENKGLGGAINTGLKQITGEYFTWCDSDNFYTPDYFFEKHSYMENHPDCAIVRCDGYIVNETDITRPISRMSDGSRDKYKRDLFENALLGVGFHYGCAMLRTSRFDEVVPGREIYESRQGQNWQLLLPMLYRFDSGYIDKPMFCFVVREDSLSSGADRSSLDVKFTQLEEYKNILIKTMERMDMGSNREKYLSMAEDRHVLYKIMALPHYGQYGLAARLYRRYPDKRGLSIRDRLYYRSCTSRPLYSLYSMAKYLKGKLSSFRSSRSDFSRIEGGAGDYALFDVPRSDCTGCCACMNACPGGCITMKQDAEGFRYPFINMAKCTGCGMCEAVCPVNNTVKLGDRTAAWACYNKDEGERLSSSSGGIFPLLAWSVLDKGGVVYGARFDREFGVVHARADSIEQAQEFKGSKYVQSYIGKTYKDLKTKLEDGSPVLFSGTPCQCAGLKSYLGRDWEKLLCVDFICHGVPSPAVWRDYIRMLSPSGNPKNVSFRDKSTGWKSYSLSLDTPNGTLSERGDKSRFLRGFIMDLYLRKSCYSCRYKGGDRCSDITLADLWGAQYFLPSMDDDMGLSLVVLHTQKGEDAFEEIKTDIVSSEVDMETALRYNPSAVKSATLRDTRRRFFEDYSKIPFGKLMDKYCKAKLMDIIKRSFYMTAAKIKSMLKRK